MSLKVTTKNKLCVSNYIECNKLLKIETDGACLTELGTILCLPAVTTHDQIPQAFPLHICILQAIKQWRWEEHGNEATGLALPEIFDRKTVN